MRRSKIADRARLARLEIENFGLIASAALDFSEGFTVCTGETGSGKTMLLGALAFVLGERSSPDIVRAGSTRARVTLVIDADVRLRAQLTEDGLESEPGEPVLFAREMLANGKSAARINGSLVTAAQLRAYGEMLLDRVGQHEQQRLLSADYQLELLDAFAGAEALARRTAVRAGFERVAVAAAEQATLLTNAGRAQAELEFATFALTEIDDAAPMLGEDAALRERRSYLANVERIASALGSAHEALAGAEGSASEGLGTAAALVASVAPYAAELGALATTLAALQSDAGDAAGALLRALEAAEYDPVELESATARLDRLENLKKKYGGSLAAVLEARARFEETVMRETSRDERERELRERVERERAALASQARALSAERVRAARELEGRVAAELSGLAMPAARFAVTLETFADVRPAGAERARFELSPNPGEPLRALGRAASGGELSRVLLALVVVLAGRREGTALVFDEIDAGVGGAAASAVGVRLGTLALRGQIVCVTHLAQIASWADRHYVLRKREERQTTVVELVALEDRPAVEEIARMLSGSTAAVALEHAETLVRDVRTRKARA